MEKRLKVLLIIFLVIAGLLSLRLAYIQLAGHEELSAAASAQQLITLEGADKRGIIFDRNGTPIAGAYYEYIYIIKEKDFDGETQNALNKLEAREVDNKGNGYKVFTSQIYDKETGRRLIRNSDAYILKAARRYKSNQPASHIIGYVNPEDNKGVCGIELKYDEELVALDKKVHTVADVKGNLIRGYGMVVDSAAEEDSYVKEGIYTTLHLGIQNKAEQLLDENTRCGAIIAAEVESGDIVAAASTPDFDPGNIAEYLSSNNGELINKVTQGEYPPGSVFKIVVAAAALENGMDPDRKFVCKGSIEVQGNVVGCETGGESGHGEITMEEAFAYSCNCAFIEIGQIAGAAQILEMAEKLGLGKSVLDDYPQECSGNLMTVQQAKGPAIANLSIGQGETLVTPLQVAKLTCIVANGGVDPGMKLVNETSVEERCISSETADKIKKMMKKTVEEGTGSNIDQKYHAGVKTGSAESVQGGVEVVHGWVTGFFPVENPEYVVTVFVEDGKSGRSSAAPLLNAMAEYIYEQELVEYEVGL